MAPFPWSTHLAVKAESVGPWNGIWKVLWERGQVQGAVGAPRRDIYTSLEVDPKDEYFSCLQSGRVGRSSWRRGSGIFQVGISCSKTDKWEPYGHHTFARTSVWASGEWVQRIGMRDWRAVGGTTLGILGHPLGRTFYRGGILIMCMYGKNTWGQQGEWVGVEPPISMMSLNNSG